jgi:hypothetical protein
MRGWEEEEGGWESAGKVDKGKCSRSAAVPAAAASALSRLGDVPQQGYLAPDWESAGDNNKGSRPKTG